MIRTDCFDDDMREYIKPIFNPSCVVDHLEGPKKFSSQSPTSDHLN